MGKLTVGLDFRPALSRATGVGRYFQGLVAGLARVDREHDFVLFSSSWKERAVPEPRPDNFRLVDRRLPVRVLNALWNRAEAPTFDFLAGERVDVAHSPTPLLLPARNAKRIVTICDLFFLDRPEATTAEIRRDYASLAASHAKRADAILAISETTAADVVSKLGVPEERVFVVHAGLDERFRRGLETSASGNGGGPGGGDYLLTVATLEPRKNLVTLLEALARLRARGFDGKLRLAGGPGVDAERIERTIDELRLGGTVERLGYVPADALPALYRGARVAVMPSLWEGFGLPLLEAMASETPIVATDLPVHHEVAGDAAVYAPALDADAIADAIERAWRDAAMRETLIARGVERVKRFTWDASARRAMELYDSLGSGAG